MGDHCLPFFKLRDEPKASIDHVWKEVKYQVLAIDISSNQVMLDREIANTHDSIWFHDGNQIKVSQIDGAVCTVCPIDFFENEDEFVQRIFISKVDDILDSFTQHLLPPWNQLAQLPEEVWNRVTKFTQAHMPRYPFTLPKMDTDMSQKAVFKFKPKAARGPDGFNKDDLKNMPQSFVHSLLTMLQQIETTDAMWPPQLLFWDRHRNCQKKGCS